LKKKKWGMVGQPKTPNSMYESGLRLHSTYLLLDSNTKGVRHNMTPVITYGH